MLGRTTPQGALLTDDARHRLDAVREALDVFSAADRWLEAAERQWASLSVSLRQVDEVSGMAALDEYSEPAVVLDYVVANSWRAANDWHPEHLMETHPEAGTALRVGDGDEPVRVTISDFLHYCHAECYNDKTPLYLWDYEFGERAPTLLDGYLEPTTCFPEDLMSLMGAERPPFRWFAIGAAGSGCDVHQDPVNTCAWNVLVHGRKRWALLHPSLSAQDVGAHSLDDDKPTAAWFLQTLPAIAAKHGPSRVMVVDQPPGSLLYVPVGWWHTTWNLSTVSVAVTHNVVSWPSFATCWDRVVRVSVPQTHAECATLRAEDATNVLNGLASEYGLVDAQQAARWLMRIEQHATERGLAEPGGLITQVIAAWQRESQT